LKSKHSEHCCNIWTGDALCGAEFLRGLTG
jgi:hypothetical protein